MSKKPDFSEVLRRESARSGAAPSTETQLVSYYGSGQLVAYTTAAQIAKAYPRLSDQLEYEKGMKLLGDFTKDHAFYVAALEAQVAIAQTLPNALKLGDIEAKGNHYTMSQGDIVLHNQSVSRWRGVAAVAKSDRQRFYAENTKPTRAALLRWANPNEPLEAGPIEKFGSDDACIETTSVYKGPAGCGWLDKYRLKVGWTIDEKKQTDYIVYTWPEGTARRYWIVPYPFLQAASIRWWRQWVVDYGEKPAINPTYLTLSVYPPRRIIVKAMRSLMVGSVEVDSRPLPQTDATQHQLGFDW